MTRRLVERLTPFAVEHGVVLDEASVERLASFVDLLSAWNRKARLTGDRDPEILVEKHCADSLVASAELSVGYRTMDVGSGAGFPGLVAAIVRPDVPLTLIDPREKACSFLDAVAARLSVANARVLNARVEDVPGLPGEAGSFDLVLSRGLRVAPLLEAIRCVLGRRGELLMMLSGRQEAPDPELRALGYRELRVREYTLPTGEDRRIVRYAAA